MSNEASNRALVIVSAPSGGGKTTLCARLLDEFHNLKLSISSTTRAPRGDEKNGLAYWFISVAEFEKKIADGDFAEWAKVHDNYYGTSKTTLEKYFTQSQAVLLDIDVQGARQLKKIYGKDAITLFLSPPSLEVLEQRLRGRGTDPEATILKRLRHADHEMKAAGEFDACIINDDLNRAYTELSKNVRNFLMARKLA